MLKLNQVFDELSRQFPFEIKRKVTQTEKNNQKKTNARSTAISQSGNIQTSCVIITESFWSSCLYSVQKKH